MDMKQAIQRVADRQNLTRAEAEEVMELLLTGAATQAQIGAFLTLSLIHIWRKHYDFTD